MARQKKVAKKVKRVPDTRFGVTFDGRRLHNEKEPSHMFVLTPKKQTRGKARGKKEK